MHALLSIAVKAARSAANIIVRGSLDLEQEKVDVRRKGPNDYLTEVDIAAETAIINVIREAYPDHDILTEESGLLLAGSLPSEYQWIVDPLDGTRNFIHGFPNYAISIAVAVRGVISHACIYDPLRNELFTASRGSGSFLNDRRVRVSRCGGLPDALISGRFDAVISQSDRACAARFYPLVDGCSGYRRLGSTVLELAYVACGRLDGFCGSELNAWDIAAGTLLVTEAGGLVGDFEGEQSWLRTGNTMAASPKVFTQMVSVLEHPKAAE